MSGSQVATAVLRCSEQGKEALVLACICFIMSVAESPFKIGSPHPGALLSSRSAR